MNLAIRDAKSDAAQHDIKQSKCYMAAKVDYTMSISTEM